MLPGKRNPSKAPRGTRSPASVCQFFANPCPIIATPKSRVAVGSQSRGLQEDGKWCQCELMRLGACALFNSLNTSLQSHVCRDLGENLQDVWRCRV